jgi:hypothetical protein
VQPGVLEPSYRSRMPTYHRFVSCLRKGVEEGRFTAAFRTSADGLYFVAGQRRVVYASSLGGGRWSTACARSAVVLRPAEQEVADLARCGGKSR